MTHINITIRSMLQHTKKSVLFVCILLVAGLTPRAQTPCSPQVKDNAINQCFETCANLIDFSQCALGCGVANSDSLNQCVKSCYSDGICLNSCLSTLLAIRRGCPIAQPCPTPARASTSAAPVAAPANYNSRDETMAGKLPNALPSHRSAGQVMSGIVFRLSSLLGLGWYARDTASAALATTIAVNSTADGALVDLATNTTCDLREAIAAANTNTAVGQCPAGMAGLDTITFAPGVTGVITLMVGELAISEALTITGPGAPNLIISGNNASRVFNINPIRSQAGNFDVSLSELTIANGRVGGVDAQGGGILKNSTGTLTITNIVITGNTASASGNSAVVSLGGGIHNFGGTVNISNSTITGNTATATGGSINFSAGGGINNGGNGRVNVSNSTITGNTATATGSTNNQVFGAGIYNEATLNVSNSTISGNSASASGGSSDNGGGNFGDGGGIYNYGTANVKSTIIAENSAPTSGPDVAGTFNSSGYNLIGNNCGSTGFTQPTDQAGTPDTPINPLLGPLGNYGGPTPTRPPLPGSPALDKGNSFGLTTDQRGFARRVDLNIANATDGDSSDIGAYEIACQTVTAQVSGGGAIRPGQSATVTVMLTGGSAPYTVTLSNGGGTLTGASPLSFTLSPQSTTTYTIASATDGYDCPATASGSATITVDATPPTIACPGNQVGVIAGTTGPVTYPTPVVSDDRPGVTFNCTPAAGSNFALGVRAVNCTASDAVGNMATCSFTMTVRQPRSAIKDLIARVRSLAPSTLTTAQANQLIGHLELANSNLERGQTAAACTNLQNFVNAVNGLRTPNGPLSNPQAQDLISYANKIRNAVGCAGGPF